MSKKITFNRKIKALIAVSVIGAASFLVSFEPSMAQLGIVKTGLGSFYNADAHENQALSGFLTEGKIGDVPLSSADAVRAFYEARQNQPLWTGTITAYNRARTMASFIENSWTHGLNPQRYHLQEITDRINETDESLQAELELFLTDAAIKYATDMSGQRVQGLKEEVSLQHAALTPTDVLNMIAASNSLRTTLTDLEPKSGTYKKLREALVDLTGKEDAKPFKLVDFGGSVMKPGLRHKNMPDLRARLSATQQTADPALYDDAIFAAVTKFQRDAGLKDDGIIGSDTLAAINRSNSDRIRQLKVNMERLRWMEGQARPDKFVVVNIPAATLWAVDSSGVSFEMQVIVGRPERPTPAIVADIEGIRFNPTWTVPPTIKKEDILPKLREDPHYLTNKGIELTVRTEEGTETLDPSAIDWDDVTSNELHKMNMVQVAGTGNPLGTVRVLMPNKYSIYLHDTNQPEYFDKYARALSSGCIRMKEPLRVAEFIMHDEKGWDLNKIQSVIGQGKTRDQLIATKIPVYILYYTVWIDDQGRIVFGRDIYGRDKILADALEKVDGTSLAGHNIIMTNGEKQKLAALGKDE